MFIRIKRIKGAEYAYLVKNVWSKSRDEARDKMIRAGVGNRTGGEGKVGAGRSVFERSKPKVRQKSLKYLGRVVRLNPKSETSEPFEIMLAESGIDINLLCSEEIIRLLIGHELLKLGFRKVRGVFCFEGVCVNLNKRQIRQKGRNVVLALNNDFLCGFTLRRLLNFTFQGTGEEVGLEFAKAFVSAGIPVPEDVFVFLFSRIFREGGLSRL